MPSRPTTAEQQEDARRLRALFKDWRSAQMSAGGRGPNQEAIADMLGVGQSALSQRLSGKLALNKEFAAKISSLLGCRVADFSPTLAQAISDISGSDSEEFTLVKRADVKLSAGHGILIFDEGSKSSLSFRTDFLRAQGVSPSNAVLVNVKGRSMEPTIPDGSVLLLNCADRGAAGGRIYAFRHDGELLVKRMHRTTRGYLAVSDNPDRQEFPDREIVDDNGDFDLIGRAIWMGASL